jgi:hypothetical protein
MSEGSELVEPRKLPYNRGDIPYGNVIENNLAKVGLAQICLRKTFARLF